MRPAAKLASFAVVLSAAFAGGAALGSAVGPIDVGPVAPTHPEMDQPAHGSGEHVDPAQSRPTDTDPLPAEQHDD